MTDPQPETILRAACAQVGLDPAGAEMIKHGENILYRLPHQRIVARINQVGQAQAAAREVQLAHWLQAEGVPAVQALPTARQPVQVEGRPVTFWLELPPTDPEPPSRWPRRCESCTS